jgi:hypothetical protein
MSAMQAENDPIIAKIKPSDILKVLMLGKVLSIFFNLT